LQAETNVNDEGVKKTVKIPIAVLKVGETRSLHPNVEFPNGSVTFKLVQGTGPVYVCGKVICSLLIIHAICCDYNFLYFNPLKAEMNFGEYDDVHNMYEEYSDEEDESDVELDDEVSPQTNGKSNKKK